MFSQGEAIPVELALDFPSVPFATVQVTCGEGENLVANLVCVKAELEAVKRGINGGQLHGSFEFWPMSGPAVVR